MSGFKAFKQRTTPTSMRGSLAFKLMLLLGIALFPSQRVSADESGASFWLPGSYGSLAAAPAQPGWSFATANYYTSVGAGKDTKFVLGGGVEVGLNARVDFQYFNATYVFATPVLGAQAAFGVGGLFGTNTTSVFGTLSGPGGPLISGGRKQTSTGIGDLYPTGSLRWNQGVNNFLAYATGDVPVGLYNSQNLANLGIGHGAVDAGGGYTYFNPQNGRELSVVVGATYNLMNPSTHYQNGVDAHLDWGASQFLTPNMQIGAAGYVYRQITGDSGSGAKLGSFESRVIGIGPQIGFLFPAGDMQGYVNLKGYKEFDAQARPTGYNLWLTLSISPAAPTPAKVIAAKY